MARPHIVIVGAGFGGLSAAHALAGADADVTVIDRRNYHLFQPLLYQVATAGLSPAQIASPIRAILRHAANVQVLLGKVNGVDKERRTVTLDDRTLSYDYAGAGDRRAALLFRPRRMGERGARPQEDRRRHGHPPPHPDRVRAGRGRPTSHEARRRFLTFVVIGGGPTGVEMAGAIAELARVALRHDFRNIDPREARIVLVEAGPRVLPAFPRGAERRRAQVAREAGRRGPSRHAGHALRRRGRDDRRRPAGGRDHHLGRPASRPRRPRRWLGAEKDRVGRVMVGPDLTAARPSRDLLHRRHRACAGRRRQAVAGPRAGRQAAGRLCRARAARPAGRQARAEAVPLPRLRHHGHDRPAGRRRRFRLAEARRHAGLAAVGRSSTCRS